MWWLILRTSLLNVLYHLASQNIQMLGRKNDFQGLQNVYVCGFVCFPHNE